MKPFQWGIIVFFTVCLVVSAQEGVPAVTRLSREEYRSAVMASNQHLAAARLRCRQALMELKNAETEIGNALDTAMRQVGSTHEQAGHQQGTVEFYARLFESEMGRLDAGRSDSRRVLQVEQELVDARIASFQSLVDHRRAWLDWELVQGIFLDVRRLEPDSGP